MSKFGTAKVCPGCDSTDIYRLRKSLTGASAETPHSYRCLNCGATFDDPNERERHGPGRLVGLSGKLDAADPDEVGAQ